METRVLTHDIAGDGEPLILVPGGLTGWVSWIPHQERLRTRFRVIRVQPIHNELGSAGQAGDPTYTVEVERESLRLTLDELGIEQAHFAGWSGGGKALIEFALAHLDRVSTLTLVEPAAYWILEQLGQSDPELDAFNEYMESLAGKEVTEDDLAIFLVAAGFVDDASQARQDPYWERALPHRATLSWLPPEFMRSSYSVEDLATITCPVLLTKGSDTAPWEKRVVDILGKRLPNARVIELEGTHAHHIESIDRFLDELETHMRAARVA